MATPRKQVAAHQRQQIGHRTAAFLAEDHDAARIDRYSASTRSLKPAQIFELRAFPAARIGRCRGGRRGSGRRGRRSIATRGTVRRPGGLPRCMKPDQHAGRPAGRDGWRAHRRGTSAETRRASRSVEFQFGLGGGSVRRRSDFAGAAYAGGKSFGTLVGSRSALSVSSIGLPSRTSRDGDVGGGHDIVHRGDGRLDAVDIGVVDLHDAIAGLIPAAAAGLPGYTNRTTTPSASTSACQLLFLVGLPRSAVSLPVRLQRQDAEERVPERLELADQLDVLVAMFRRRAWRSRGPCRRRTCVPEREIADRFACESAGRRSR